MAAATAVRSPTPAAAVARRASAFVGVAAALGAYWLVPAAVSLGADATQLTGYGRSDLAAFTAAGTVGGNVPLSVAALYGFWRGGYRTPFDAVPAAVVVAAFAVLLWLAVDGWVGSGPDADADGLVLVGAAGFVLALGVSVPATAPLFRGLTETLPGFVGMRDSQKFSGLLVLSYALLGGRSVDRLAAGFDGRPNLRDAVGEHAPSGQVALRVVLLACVVALPAAYAAPMFGGLSGQLDVTRYPADWHAADNRTYDPDADHRVLFLPWHGYLRLPWVGRTVATPADQFFRQPTVQSRSLGVAGVGPRPPTPTHVRVSRLLDRRAAAAVGPHLADLGVRYVVISKSADHERYGYLRREPGLHVVRETAHLVILENRRFENAPPPSAWPRATLPVPRRALLVGAAVSTLTSLACAGAALRGRGAA